VLSSQPVERREDADGKVRKNVEGLTNPPKIRRCSHAGKIDGRARKEVHGKHPQVRPSFRSLII
jgi:hypothetical protein